jgi:sterol desaturase/sphingolipid hydroxylase (fatty acid hydroxylase superfamily)
MTTSLLDPALNWITFGGFWLLLVMLAAVELRWPMHVAPRRPNGRLLTNFGMGLINMVLLSVLPISVIATAQWARDAGFGLLNQITLPGGMAAAISIAVRSLAGYLVHRISHSQRLLWRIHRVHHYDVAVDLSTAFRNHPIEALFVASCLIAVTAFAGLAPIPLALYETIAFAFSIWAHANMKLPRRIEPIVRGLFVTPDMHHVHHSTLRHEADSNYGDVFSLWDRLFGSYSALDRSAVCALRFGQDESDEYHSASIARQLRSPLLPNGPVRNGKD